MEITETVVPENRDDWREWLNDYHSYRNEIWVIFYKKHTGRNGLQLSEAVEEALCFGWIDGILKRIDEERYTVRFTPRRKGSIWSETNVERVERMKAEGKMTEAGLQAFKYMDPEKIDRSVYSTEPELPHEFADLFRERGAFEAFMLMPPSHRKHYTFWITMAKRKETKRRRAEKAVDMILEGKTPGM